VENENPFAPGRTVNDDQETPASETNEISAGHAAYNVVSDTVTGLNVRKSDNKFQVKFIFVSVVLLALIGAFVAWLNSAAWYGGAMAGAFCGLIVGMLTAPFIAAVIFAIVVPVDKTQPIKSQLARRAWMLASPFFIFPIVWHCLKWLFKSRAKNDELSP